VSHKERRFQMGWLIFREPEEEKEETTSSLTLVRSSDDVQLRSAGLARGVTFTKIIPPEMSSHGVISVT
jgi:hypothetical protein